MGRQARRVGRRLRGRDDRDPRVVEVIVTGSFAWQFDTLPAQARLTTRTNWSPTNLSDSIVSPRVHSGRVRLCSLSTIACTNGLLRVGRIVEGTRRPSVHLIGDA